MFPCLTRLIQVKTGEGANPEEAESLIQFDTLVLHDLSRLSRRTPLAFQAKRIVPDLQKDLKRRLDRIVKNPVLVYEIHEFKNTTR